MHSAYSGVWIDGTAIDIEVVFSQHFWTFVNCSARPIEYTAQHVLGDTNFQIVACKFYLGLSGVSFIRSIPKRHDPDLLDIDTSCALEDLVVFSTCP